MQPLLKTVSWLLFLYAAYCGLLFVLQRHILFPRGMIPQPLQSGPNKAGLEKFRLDVGFGKADAWLIAPAAGRTAAPFPAVIFGHGKEIMITYDAGHNDCPPDWDVFWQDLAFFLREIRII